MRYDEKDFEKSGVKSFVMYIWNSHIKHNIVVNSNDLSKSTLRSKKTYISKYDKKWFVKVRNTYTYKYNEYKKGKIRIFQVCRDCRNDTKRSVSIWNRQVHCHYNRTGSWEKKGRHFADDIFKCIFLNENYPTFHWNLFLVVQLKMSEYG